MNGALLGWRGFTKPLRGQQGGLAAQGFPLPRSKQGDLSILAVKAAGALYQACLLYTSDAADE